MNVQVRPPICHVFIFALVQTLAIQLQAAPEMTKEKFDSFPEAVGGGFAYEKGKAYSVKGKIVQVGTDYVQVESLLDKQSFGVIKITPQFLENFPGQKGTIVFFLSEFAGYANFTTRIGGSIRLAIFDASHYLPLDGGSIQVVNKELADKVVAATTSSGVSSPPKTSNAEGGKPMKSDLNVDPKIRILGEWMREESFQAGVTKHKLVFKEDGIFEDHLGVEFKNPIFKSSDGTKVFLGKWTVSEGQIHTEFTDNSDAK